MANTKQIQDEALSTIHAAKALVEKVLSIVKIITLSPSLSANFSVNPIRFLIQILKDLGVTREEIELFLTKFLVYIIPILEVSVKAILLTNLKNMISCSVDPRIPEKYRKQHKTIKDYNTSQEHGIDINIESIDFLDKLSINPLGDFGSLWYFGLEGVEDSYKFARADDMDAFLWFVIHKGKFPNSTKISKISNIGGGDARVLPTDGNGSLLSIVEAMFSEDAKSSILLGNTFAYDNGHIISMCIDRKLDDADNIIHNTLVPTSDDWSSVNWYARRADQLGKNLGFGWGINKDTGNSYYKGKLSTKHSDAKARDFSKEKAICNIQYINQSSSDSPITGLVNNKFRFTILPKPYIHVPIISQGEPPWRFKKMLFNDKGEYDANGKYTFASPPTEEKKGGNIIFTTEHTTVTMDIKSGDVTVENPMELVKELIECYPGLTVYEFNYDYVMSVKLFDAKVLAHSLIESVTNMNMGLSGGLIQRHQEGTEMLKEIIKNIVNTDDAELNDCYYTFDNSKYEALLRKAEEKRAKQQRFGNITHEIGVFDSVDEILKEYDENAKLNEKIDILHRAITQASVIVSEGSEDEDKFDVEFNFIFDLIENLTTVLVNAILSPKVLMLLEVNQKIMGGTWEKFTLKDLLMALRSIIVAIIKEIRDLIIQELLKLALDKLEPIKLSILAVLLREQLENYSDAITDIMKNCPPIWFRFSNKYQDTKLDVVDYADIDTTITNGGEQPITNKC